MTGGAPSPGGSGPRPVLCALDGSPVAEAVARAGACLARTLDAPLVLLHVARASRGRRPLELLHGRHQAEDLESARALLRDHAARLPIALTLELATGSPREQILAAAFDLEAVALVVGEHERGLLSTLRGSLPRQIAAEAPCPTLVVPERAEERDLDGPVVCGVDAGDAAARAARVGAGLAGALGERIILVSVVLPAAAAVPLPPAAPPASAASSEIEQEWRDAVRVRLERMTETLGAATGAEAAIEVGAPAEQMCALARDRRASVIALGASGRGVLHAALSGSVAPAVLSASERPVLLVP